MMSHETLPEDARIDALLAAHALDGQTKDLNLRGFEALELITTPSPSCGDAEYDVLRSRFVQVEQGLSFDSTCRARATPLERKVDAIIHGLRQQDRDEIYGAAKPRQGYARQTHPRSEGDHFLSNRNLIAQTKLFRVLQRMPKGTHLHIHYNACLPPATLLAIAKGMDRMYITSNLPLSSHDDFFSYDKCELQFSIRSQDAEKPGNLFSPNYQPQQTMKFADFLNHFPRHYRRATVDDWLRQKLIFQEEEAHGMLQTAAG